MYLWVAQPLPHYVLYPLYCVLSLIMSYTSFIVALSFIMCYTRFIVCYILRYKRRVSAQTAGTVTWVPSLHPAQRQTRPPLDSTPNYATGIPGEYSLAWKHPRESMGVSSTSQNMFSN